jgi:hypothetical protein
VFRQFGFLAILCCFWKPHKSAEFALLAQEIRKLFLELEIWVDVSVFYSVCFSSEGGKC